MCDPQIYVNRYGNICRNRGALTSGIPQDQHYIKGFDRDKANLIAKTMRNNNYNWSPTRITMIPKPGTNKKRPIDTPTQKDRIVQEAIKSILEAIFEPEFKEFEEQNDYRATNYGFRPSKSAYEGLKNLSRLGKLCTIAIEGDIVGAYNAVNHDVLIGFISERIKDKDFINLLKSLLKNGVMYQGKFIDSLTGTPQDGIVSPLLFNIYMFSFDKFIYKEIALIMSDNIHKPKSPKASKAYNSRRKATEKLTKELKNGLPKGSLEYRAKEKELRKSETALRKIPYADPDTNKLSAVYSRYADDWVLMLTGNRSKAKLLKTRISQLINKELKLELDPEKTKITRLTQGISFLGYEIVMVRHGDTPKKDKNGKYQRFNSRRIGIIPCKQRLRAN